MFLADLSNFSLQGLRIFSYVASLGSVAEAARVLGLTQPAVSLQIHNLENQLGFALFERQGRRNVLSSKGQSLLQQLLPQLENLEQTLILARNSDKKTRQDLLIGSLEGIGEYWLRARFSDFSQKHENLRLFLEIADNALLEERLITGRLFTIITSKKIEHPRVISQVFMDEKLLPVGSKRAMRRLRELLEKMSPEQAIKEISWIGYGDSANQDPWTLRWFEAQHIVLSRHFEYSHQVNSYAVIKQLLIESDGVCVAPRHTFEKELETGELVCLESAKFPVLKNRLYLSYREGSLNKVHSEFKDWITKMAGGMS